MPAVEFNRLIASEGLSVVEEYRKKYRQQDKPGRYVASEYAKTMITVGPPEPIQPLELNLPIEFVLRYPQLLQLNFRGAPIEGIQVSLNGKAIGRTNGAGQLPLPLLNSGSKLTATVVRVYPDPSTAPWEFFHASMTLPPLSQRQAAVHDGQLAGDEARGGEIENNGVGDLIAGAETSGRSFVAQGKQWGGIGLLKGDGSGGHAVDTDRGGPGAGQGLGHVDDTGLRGAVVGIVGPRLDTADGGNVDDASLPARHHAASSLLGTKKVGFEVGGMDKVPIGLGNFERIDASEASRIVNEPIEGAGLGEEALDFTDAGKIG